MLNPNTLDWMRHVGNTATDEQNLALDLAVLLLVEMFGVDRVDQKCGSVWWSSVFEHYDSDRLFGLASVNY